MSFFGVSDKGDSFDEVVDWNNDDNNESTKIVDVQNITEVEPLLYHWYYYYKKSYSEAWEPFTNLDSANLEKAFREGQNNIVSTNGGRYDVNIDKRQRISVYWKEEVSIVQRCSWFYRLDHQNAFVPYSENFSEQLESLYLEVIRCGNWYKKIEIGDGDSIIIHNHTSMVHFVHRSRSSKEWNILNNDSEVRLMKRLIVSSPLNDDEPESIDHLLLFVHGIGSSCDAKFRSMIDCVDDFRNISHQMIGSHLKETGRIEYLPIQWHHSIHDDATGIDNKLENITLKSIGKLRQYTNDTLLDILLYGSPIYAQRIIETVVDQMNSRLLIFMNRNPEFKGSISVAGHSLGSLILFDILRNQITDLSSDEIIKYNQNIKRSTDIYKCKGTLDMNLPSVKYPLLSFHPYCFFALGSPISMFLTVRGIDSLGPSFKFPTCKRFYNIFHPFDPVAYRFEPLIEKDFPEKPVLIPHHKGRKRFHLELKENLSRVGYDIKERLWSSVVSTWQTISDSSLLSRVTRSSTPASSSTQDNATSKNTDDATGKNNATCKNTDVTMNINNDDATCKNTDDATAKNDAICKNTDVTMNINNDYAICKNTKDATIKDAFYVYCETTNDAARDRALEVATVSNTDDVSATDEVGKDICNTRSSINGSATYNSNDRTIENSIKVIDTATNNDSNIATNRANYNANNVITDFENSSFITVELVDSNNRVSIAGNQAKKDYVSTDIHGKMEKQNVEGVDEDISTFVSDARMLEDDAAAATAENSVVKDENSYDNFGCVNQGRRIDFVLQEAPIERINEYIFALSSHGCYWESEDTVLMIVKEIYT